MKKDRACRKGGGYIAKLWDPRGIFSLIKCIEMLWSEKRLGLGIGKCIREMGTMMFSRELALVELGVLSKIVLELV